MAYSTAEVRSLLLQLWPPGRLYDFATRTSKVSRFVDALAESLSLADERGARRARKPRVLPVDRLFLLARAVGGSGHQPHETAVPLAPVVLVRGIGDERRFQRRIVDQPLHQLLRRRGGIALAQAFDAREVVVFVPITSKHVLAVRFEGCPKGPRQARQQVYEIAASTPQASERPIP